MAGRWWLTNILLLCCTLVSAQVGPRMAARSSNSVIVLIEPDRFDPAVDPATFVHPTWVRWPEQAPAAGGLAGDNRLLSIASGIDWFGGVPVADFSPEGILREEAFGKLLRRGYFEARRHNLRGTAGAVIRNSSGAVATRAMVPALNGDSPAVKLVAVDGRWPPEDLMFMKANSGAEVFSVVRHTSGRVLVVEYPPRAAGLRSVPLLGQPAVSPNWSRMWLLGATWPTAPGSSSLYPRETGMDVPGLVSASSLARLALFPQTFSWSPMPPTWNGANRWFIFVQASRGPLLLGLFFCLAVLLCVVAVFAAQEKRSHVLCSLVRAMMLAPAAIVAGGQITRLAGTVGGFVWIGVAWLGLLGAAAAFNLLATRISEWEPTVGFAVVSFLALFVSDPRYSLLGGVFEHGPVTYGGEVFGGLLCSFLVLCVVLSAGGMTHHLLIVGFGLMFGIASTQLHPAWSSENWLFGAWWLVVAMLSIDWARFAWMAMILPVAPGVASALTFGIVWLPPGMVENRAQIGALNVGEIGRFLFSPVFLGSALLAMGILLYASKFLYYQVKLVWRERAPVRPLGHLAAVLMVGGIVDPPLLRAGIISAFAVALMLAEDLMRLRDLVD